MVQQNVDAKAGKKLFYTLEGERGYFAPPIADPRQRI
jgi:hypothetical protein